MSRSKWWGGFVGHAVHDVASWEKRVMIFPDSPRTARIKKARPQFHGPDFFISEESHSKESDSVLRTSNIVNFLTKSSDQQERAKRFRAVARFGWRLCRPGSHRYRRPRPIDAPG